MITATRPIADLTELLDHLQYAIGLELTTIPTYLCGLYSIEDGANSAASDVIQSVVMEEMLHMALAANILNAIGGAPSTGPVGDGPSPVPTYPTKVPFIDAIPEIHLQPFSPDAVDEFLSIERPAEEDQPTAGPGEQYSSIGAFYAAIEDALTRLCAPDVFEAAAASRAGCQLTSRDYYGGAGTLIKVTNLETALDALAEIVREGEGSPYESRRRTARQHRGDGFQTPGRALTPYDVIDADELPFGWKMYSHYARFAEIRAGRTYLPDQLIGEAPRGDMLPVDWGAVRAMEVDPTAAEYEGTPAHEPMVACNAAYTALVDSIYRSFNGDRTGLRQAVHHMYDLKYRACALLNTPSPLHPDRRLGPAFEYRSAAPAGERSGGAQ